MTQKWVVSSNSSAGVATVSIGSFGSIVSAIEAACRAAKTPVQHLFVCNLWIGIRIKRSLGAQDKGFAEGLGNKMMFFLRLPLQESGLKGVQH